MGPNPAHFCASPIGKASPRMHLRRRRCRFRAIGGGRRSPEDGGAARTIRAELARTDLEFRQDIGATAASPHWRGRLSRSLSVSCPSAGLLSRIRSGLPQRRLRTHSSKCELCETALGHRFSGDPPAFFGAVFPTPPPPTPLVDLTRAPYGLRWHLRWSLVLWPPLGRHHLELARFERIWLDLGKTWPDLGHI